MYQIESAFFADQIDLGLKLSYDSLFTVDVDQIYSGVCTKIQISVMNSCRFSFPTEKQKN